MKLWQKDKASLKEVEAFTVGNDRDMDLYLAPFDVLGSMAHIRMLESIGLLTSDELMKLTIELRNIYNEVTAGSFTLDEGVEDIHSQVELMLTRRLGDVGKKIHSGRSRNDQVLVDLRLFFRHEIRRVTEAMQPLFTLLMELSEKHQEHLLPGYTHFQLAMPSSFGLWFGAYAESLADDLNLLAGTYRMVNRNPLGSGAGFGSSFPLNRTMTTELLGFESLNYNVVYAQMTRGKVEKNVAFALAGIGATLARLAMDACLFMNQNFAFISFPDELTTGSSIMPHKKNPDVFELIRARCNQIASVPNSVAMLTANLPSGYHRDMQLLKEMIFPAFENLIDCLRMMTLMLSNIRVRENILDDDQYRYLFSVEEVNKRVLAGVPFRDAYRQVGKEIESGAYNPPRSINHTHEGSIGNLCNERIQGYFDETLRDFDFRRVDHCIQNLLGVS
ncbi:MAG TPA: argininosuccinate lyase [Cyclobacteriaceae bacterium]